MALRDLFRNLGAPVPLPAKIGLVLRNTAYKVWHRSACCGRPGEPGC